MDNYQLTQLAQSLNIDPFVLIAIYRRYRPQTTDQLINLATATPETLASLPQQLNPIAIKFDDAFRQGHQFVRRGFNDLVGQCAWFAEQITRLPDGSTWVIGNSVGEKMANLQQHRARGNAFLRGEARPEVGQSVVINTGGQYGHVAVINEILPDGRLKLTESNWNNDLRVSHDRIIDANDGQIMGFLRTKPTEEFKSSLALSDTSQPTTPKTPRQDAIPPQNRQELPVEEQPVKSIDLKVGNPNAKRLSQETRLDNTNLNSIIKNQPLPASVSDQVKSLRSYTTPGAVPIRSNQMSVNPLPKPTPSLISSFNSSRTPMTQAPKV